MKVEKIKLKTVPKLSTAKQSKAKIQQITFSATLREAEEKEFKDFLKKLLSEIEKQGNILSNNITFEELKKYKTLVKKFLQEVVARIYKFDKRINVDTSGRQKILSTIKKVNDELEEITRMTLRNEKDKLLLLAKIGEIKGMLVDLIW